MKAGESPRWEPRVKVSLERALGEHANLYKLGLACEGESFGIGAFAYYRRIVEQLIEGFVDQLEGERKAKTYATLVHSVTNRETSE